MTQLQIQAQIDSITDQLIKKYKPRKIFLFGSSATGEMTPDSDLDFLIIKDDKKKPYNRIVEVYGLVKKDIAADFIIYTPQELAERVKLGDPFIASILSEGKVLYG
ncbi:MAG: nucleotidyltransferase domain-containing protein [Candidatus Daviesbacteria bacterium]|nr:nucleotidyltransferase domain-containing protein [Candidatus Daviesbacteria bacterium]